MALALLAACGGDSVGAHKSKERTARHREELLTNGKKLNTQRVAVCVEFAERTDGADVALIAFRSLACGRVAGPTLYGISFSAVKYRVRML